MKALLNLEVLKQSGQEKVALETLLDGEILDRESFEKVIKKSLELGVLITVDKDEKLKPDMEESHLIEQYFIELKELETISINELYTILKKSALTSWDEEEIVAYFLNVPAQVALHYYTKKALFLDLLQEGTIGLLEGIGFYSTVREYDVEYILTLFAGKKIIDYVTIQKLEEGTIEQIGDEFKLLHEKKRDGLLTEEEKERFLQLQFLANSDESLDVPELSKALLTLNEEQRDVLASVLGLFKEKTTVEELAIRKGCSVEEVQSILEVALETMKDYLIENGDLNAIEALF